MDRKLQYLKSRTRLRRKFGAMDERTNQSESGGVRVAEYGFTLVELMVTVVLIALLAALSVPSINRVMERSDARSAARSVANRMRVARDQALSRGEVVLVGVDTQSGTSGERGEIKMYRTTDSALNCADVDTNKTSQVGDTLHLEAISGSMEIKKAPNWFCFSPEGTVYDASGSMLNSSCPSAAGMVWLGRKGSSLQKAANDLSVTKADLTDCGAKRTNTLMDARYLASVWGVEVPFNGSVRAYQ